MRKREEREDPNSCWNKAGEDEYVFVLRAKDLVAPIAVCRWAGLRIEHGLNRMEDGKIVEALSLASKMMLQRLDLKDEAEGKEPIAEKMKRMIP